jgi:hypothetical protein
MNFTPTTVVSFGGTTAISFTVISPKIITAVVGDGAKGDVRVTTPYGTASLGGFLFEAGKPGEALSAYPNPSGDFVLIKHPVLDMASVIKIIDLAGKVVKTIHVQPNVGETRIDIRELKQGLYEVAWFDGRNKLSTKIFKH